MTPSSDEDQPPVEEYDSPEEQVEEDDCSEEQMEEHDSCEEFSDKTVEEHDYSEEAPPVQEWSEPVEPSPSMPGMRQFATASVSPWGSGWGSSLKDTKRKKSKRK
jgi:hypothetical protein